MDKMILEMTITAKNKKEIVKHMLTMSKYLIDEMGIYQTQNCSYTLKKL